MRGVIYRGPSLIDGAPIVAIATTGSRNAKTGSMVQTWILRSDVEPHVAARDGQDASVCGTCPHRRQADGTRTCYVRTGDAPLSVWRAWQRGAYPVIPHGTPSALPVRIGSYGDPGALPLGVVTWLASAGPGHTGYTHRWRERPDLTPYVMASVDSDDERRDAQRLGWRTFRVRDHRAGALTRAAIGASGVAREIECVSARGVACADCGLCAGASLPGAASIWIAAHGASARRVGRSLAVLS